MLAFCFRLYAFLKRDFLMEASYRFSFLLRVFTVLFDLVIFFYLGKLMNTGDWPHEAYGGQRYFDFVLIGLATAPLCHIALSGFSQQIRHETLMGTLEPLLSTPLSVHGLMGYTYAGRFLTTWLDTFLFCFIGISFFGARFHPSSLPLAGLILFLGLAAFSGLGMLSGSLTLVYKKGEPVNRVLNALSELLGGVFFPVTILPAALQALSHLLPSTYLLHGLRMTLLEGQSWPAVQGDVFALFLLAAGLLTTGLASLGWAAEKARQDGSLSHY